MPAGFQDRSLSAATSLSEQDLCEKCRLVGAQFGAREFPCLAAIDADLLDVVLAWESISAPIRNAILALVHSAVPSERDGK